LTEGQQKKVVRTNNQIYGLPANQFSPSALRQPSHPKHFNFKITRIGLAEDQVTSSKLSREGQGLFARRKGKYTHQSLFFLYNQALLRIPCGVRSPPCAARGHRKDALVGLCHIKPIFGGQLGPSLGLEPCEPLLQVLVIGGGDSSKEAAGGGTRQVFLRNVLVFPTLGSGFS